MPSRLGSVTKWIMRKPPKGGGGGKGGGPPPKTSRETFEELDADGSGFLSIDELKEFLAAPGGGNALSEEDIGLIVAEFDSNGDGLISYAEFLTMWANGNDESGSADGATSGAGVRDGAGAAGSSSSSSSSPPTRAPPQTEATSAPPPVVNSSLAAAFAIFDKDGSGSLSVDELRAVLKRADGGAPLSDEAISQIIQELYA